MSGAMTCSAHSINVNYRSRHSFPRRSPLPHFGVLKSGILGTRRSERSLSVPLNSRLKTLPSSSRCLTHRNSDRIAVDFLFLLCPEYPQAAGKPRLARRFLHFHPSLLSASQNTPDLVRRYRPGRALHYCRTALRSQKPPGSRADPLNSQKPPDR